MSQYQLYLFLYETCVELQQASVYCRLISVLPLLFAGQLQSHRRVKRVYTIIAYGYFFLFLV